MNINGLNSYNNQVLNESPEMRYLRQNIEQSKIRESKSTTKVENTNNITSNSNLVDSNSEQLITRQERNFFIKLFPESGEQIKNHVLFTKNGKMQTPNISKGSIIDGRA